MECYRDFAYVYDMFMDQVPYEDWLRRYIEIFEEYHVPDGAIVLDMCCGTGRMTRLLSAKGYDCIGIDCSEDMLEVAREYEEEEDCTSDGSNSIPYNDNSSHDSNNASCSDCSRVRSILYLCQDMREFELYGTVAAAVCTCDSINYLLDDNDVIHFFKLMNNYLDPGAPFIFDFNTSEKYESIGDSTIAENREEASFIWENYYDADSHINEYDLTLFVREDLLGVEAKDDILKFDERNQLDSLDKEDTNDYCAYTSLSRTNLNNKCEYRYNRYIETHTQRGYSKREMREFIAQSGLVLNRFEDLEDGRILAICHEQGK